MSKSGLNREKILDLVEKIREDESIIEKFTPQLADSIFKFLTEEETWKFLTDFPQIARVVSMEKLSELRTMANPYHEPVQTNREERYMCFSFINLQEKYQKRFTTTSFIAFVYRMLSEYNIEEESLPVLSFVESFKPTLPKHLPKRYPHEVEIDSLKETPEQSAEREEYDSQLALYEQVRAKYDKELSEEQFTYKQLMYDFLDEHFKFNPDKHVKSAAYQCEEDTTRKPLEDLENTSDSEAAKRLPPMDTFLRWKRYESANFEQLREITNDVYGEKAYLDACFMPYGVGFNTIDEAKSYIRKYKREFGVEIHIAKAWNWSFLEAWRENREKLMLDDEKLAILKSIVENQQEEEKLGRDMLKKRVEKEKKKNIKKVGPDDPALSRYLKDFAPPVSKEGVGRVLEAKDLGALEPSDVECPEDALEVNVIELKNKVPDHLGKGGDVEVKTGKFFTAPEEPKSMNVIRPGEDPQKSEVKDKTIAKAFGSGDDSGVFEL